MIKLAVLLFTHGAAIGAATTETPAPAEPAPAAAIVAVKPIEIPAPTPEAVAAKPPAAEPAALAASPPPPKEEPIAALAPAEPTTGSSLPRQLLPIGLLILGSLLLVRVARKRNGTAAIGKGPSGKGRGIEIVSSKPLGGKTRALLIVVGDTEMLLAVNDQTTKLIGSWPVGDSENDEAPARAPAVLPADPEPFRVDAAHDDEPENDFDAPAPTVARDRSKLASSPALAGLLKLKKARTGAVADAGDDDDDRGQADAAWAKELVRAARKGGLAS